MCENLKFFGTGGGGWLGVCPSVTAPHEGAGQAGPSTPAGDEAGDDSSSPFGTNTPPTLLASPPPAEESEEEALEGYVVSKTRLRSLRCLHHLALCWRVPGVDYLDYDLWGSVLPAAAEYDRVCKDCWPGDQEDAPEDAHSIRSSASEAESSDSEQAASQG